MAMHKPTTENNLPTWVFIQRTAMGDYRHEIRRGHSGYMIFFNVCEATGGGISTCFVYSTYWEAFEVLVRFRSTAELVERINGAGSPESL